MNGSKILTAPKALAQPMDMTVIARQQINEDSNGYYVNPLEGNIHRPNRVTTENRGSTNTESGPTWKITPAEDQGAEILNNYGYSVTQQRRDLGGPDANRRAVYEVDGFGQVDEMSPKPTTSNGNVASAIHDKRNQGPTVLVQTDQTLDDMGSIAARTWGKPSPDKPPINTIIFANSTGEIFVFTRP